MEDKTLPRVVYGVQFIILMIYSSVSVFTLLPVFFEDLGAEPRQIGILTGLFPLAAFASRPLGGWLLSRFSPRKILIFGLTLHTTAMALYLCVRSIGWFIVFVRILQGVGFSIFLIAALFVAIMVVQEEKRAYALGVVSSGFMMPLLLFPFLGEALILRFGYVLFFLLAILLSMVPTLVAFLAGGLSSSSPHHRTDEKTTGYFFLMRQKKVLAILLLILFFEISLGSSLSFVPLLAHESPVMLSGFFFTALGLAAIFLRLYVGRRFKFWGSPHALLPAFGLLSAGGILIFFAQNNFGLILAGIISGAGAGILYPHLSALIVNGFGAGDRGKVLSLLTASVDLGFALGPFLFGWISQTTGVRTAFLPISAAVLVLSLVLLLWGRKEIYLSSRRIPS